MKYIKISEILDKTTPKEKKPKLTPEQLQKIKTISGVILGVVGAVGLVSLAVVAPGILVAVGKFQQLDRGDRKFTKQQNIEKTRRAFYYLKKSGLIKFKIRGPDVKVYLTKLGRGRFKKIQLDTLTIPKPKKWNRKWWQIAADIPTKQYRHSADLLREKLKELNFYPLQRTLWLYPFDPRTEIEYIANQYAIGKFVTLMEINRLDKQDEQIVYNHFKNLSII